MTTAYDWSQFKVHTYCKSSVADIFRMWATSSGLEKFFIKSSQFTDFKGNKKDAGAIARAGDKSLVMLHQYDIPQETESDKAGSHLNCRSCWVFFLTNLKSVLENSYYLREQNPELSDCVSVHFEPPVA